MALGTNIPSIAIKKLIPILQLQLSKLTDISAYIEIAVNSLPAGVKCNDPRILDIKQQIQNIQVLLSNIDIIRTQLGVIVNSLQIVATAAMVIKAIQMVIPAFTGVPQTPFAVLANTAETLGKNCQSGASCLGSVSNSIDGAISKLNSVLAYVISKLSAICTNEPLEVSPELASELQKRTSFTPSLSDSLSTTNDTNNFTPNKQISINTSSDGLFGNGYQSYFYNDNNVNESDLKLLETLVTDLDSAKLEVQDYLQEAPSYVITGVSSPEQSKGKIGDYYIDTTNKLIYGPKEEAGWPTKAVPII